MIDLRIGFEQGYFRRAEKQDQNGQWRPLLWEGEAEFQIEAAVFWSWLDKKIQQPRQNWRIEWINEAAPLPEGIHSEQIIKRPDNEPPIAPAPEPAQELLQPQRRSLIAFFKQLSQRYRQR